MEPTVFAGVENDWRMAREEIFGPVLVAIPWTDEEEAIRMANDSHYGLAAYIYTHDIAKALRTAHEIESGFVQVNQGGGIIPGQSYGGFKDSGIGREWSLEGMLDSFTQRKCVTVNLAYSEPEAKGRLTHEQCTHQSRSPVLRESRPLRGDPYPVPARRRSLPDPGQDRQGQGWDRAVILSGIGSLEDVVFVAPKPAIKIPVQPAENLKRLR